MTRTTRINRAAATLWASAFILVALIIVQAGRLPSNPAYGNTVGINGGYLLVTANSGRGGEADPDAVVFVVDVAAQALMVYEIENAQQKQILIRDGGPIESLFRGQRR